MVRAKRPVETLTISLITAIGLLFVLVALQSEPETIKIIDTCRGEAPVSSTYTYSFQSQGAEKITVQLSTNLLMGQVLVKVLGSNNQVYHSYRLGKRDHQQLILESPSSWQLHITERDVIGRYKIVVARQRSVADFLHFFGDVFCPSSKMPHPVSGTASVQ
jgi:hypothetical protein